MQLHPLENLSLVLLANLSLRLFHAHPLTRAVWVALVVFLLVDNHCCLDLPIGAARLIPFGIMGGAVAHAKHHHSAVTQPIHLCPFFTWWHRFGL